MNRSRRFLATVFVLMFTPALFAQAQRTFVSAGTGSDTNPCTRPSPCRNFATAIAATLPDGEVIVLDSGGYGIVLIESPISLIAPPGVYAGITAFSGQNAITVTAGTTAEVAIRGLTLNAVGGGTAVDVFTVDNLYVENVVINNFLEYGVRFELTAGNGHLFMLDSIVRKSGFGVITSATGAFNFAAGALDHVRVEHSATGITASDRSRILVRDSVVTGNGTGFRASTTSMQSASLHIKNCVTALNLTNGIHGFADVTNGVRISVADTSITYNGTGILRTGTASGSIVIESFGENELGNNAINGSFTAVVPES